MSMDRETARQCQGQTDAPQLHEIVRAGLQRFLNSMAAEGFKLPLEVSLHDSEGDILRDFRVEKGGKIKLAHSADAAALYVFPLVAVATDHGGRIAVLKLDARGTEVVEPEASVEFVN